MACFPVNAPPRHKRPKTMATSLTKTKHEILRRATALKFQLQNKIRGFFLIKKKKNAGHNLQCIEYYATIISAENQLVYAIKRNLRSSTVSLAAELPPCSSPNADATIFLFSS